MSYESFLQNLLYLKLFFITYNLWWRLQICHTLRRKSIHDCWLKHDWVKHIMNTWQCVQTEEMWADLLNNDVFNILCIKLLAQTVCTYVLKILSDFVFFLEVIRLLSFLIHHFFLYLLSNSHSHLCLLCDFFHLLYNLISFLYWTFHRSYRL